MENRKGNKVIQIIQDSIQYPELEGFVMLHDAWICRYDKVLINIEGNEYQVLHYQEIENRVMRQLTEIQTSYQFTQVFTCVKLDKKVTVGTILYVKQGEL